jgi:hypothetical protein
VKTLIAIATLLVLTALILPNIAAESAGPSIDGTYILDYRELPDGKQVRAPEIIGTMNFVKGNRNFNIYWTQDGKPASLSVISKYTFTATEYAEDNVYYMLNDAASGKPPTYDTTPASAKAAVTIAGDQIKFKFPLHDEPEVTFDKSGLTATRAGVFVDHWKRID